ncbi:hypothetical protein AHAS_Ahas12G0201400 [Arachis hypogaea]
MLYIGVAEVDERLFFHALTSKCSLVQRAEDDNHTQQSCHNYDVRVSVSLSLKTTGMHVCLFLCCFKTGSFLHSEKPKQ